MNPRIHLPDPPQAGYESQSVTTPPAGTTSSPLTHTPGSHLSPQSSDINLKAIHVCDVCTRGFSRAEHLERHQYTHLPPNSTRSFVCSMCDKGFTRKDVLTRHVRAVHETKKSEVRKSRRKSCHRCAQFKIKCNGGIRGAVSGEKAKEPCEGCRKRNKECIFIFGITVGKDGQPTTEQPEGGYESYGSSDADTRASECATKRRKIAHKVQGEMGPAVSPHLLSAARLASGDTDGLRLRGSTDDGNDTAMELAEADQLLSMATFANKGMTIPGAERTFIMDHETRPHQQQQQPQQQQSQQQQAQRKQQPPQQTNQQQTNQQYASTFMSPMQYYPPIRDPVLPVLAIKQDPGPSIASVAPIPANSQPNTNLGVGVNMLRIAEEDLNAANTLQGINPSTNRIHLSAFSSLSEHWKSDESSSLGSRPLSMLPGFRSEFPQQSTTNRMMNANIPLYNPLTDTSRPQARDTPGTTDALDLSEQAFDTTSLLGDDGDTSFFEFDLLESTDWLRDWGQHDSISPPSQPGVDNSGLDILDLSLWNTNYALSDDPPKTVLNAMNQEEERNEKTEKGPATPAPDIPAVSTPRPADETAVPVPGLPTVGGGKDYNAVTDFLPWGWQHAPGSRQDRETKPKMTLPAIRQLLGERGDRGSSEGPGRYEGTRSPASGKAELNSCAVDTLGSITDEMRSKMLEMLSTPSSRPPYALEGPEDLDRAFPNVEIVATFVRLYFQHFHPILPVIHKPSFSLERCPAILLIAMISIGASYSKLKNAKQFADGLSELCRRSLTWLSEKDPALGRTAFYLQSMCLQNLYAMGSGSTTLYDAADVSRSVLIGNARRIGLFSGSKSPTSSSPSSTPNSPSLRPGKSSPPFTASPDLETRWREWRDVEGRKRLAWGIFEYDSSFSTLSNRRGAITISDISIRLPCSESLWEASTAESWSLLLPQENDIQGYPFYSTLKLIIAGRFSVDCLTSWGKRIAAQAMGRIMWDFKELEESVLSTERDYNNPQKEALLSSLLLLCESASPPPPGSLRTEVSGDRYHWILARLIAHYTHLHAAFPTISLMLNIARKPPPQGEENADPRIRKLRRDLEGDREQGRRLAWHAAQIIALSRWNPVYSPVEGMRLFLAGVVLWGFAGFCGTGIGTGGPSSSYAGSGYAGSEGCGGTSNHDRDRERDLLRERERERERERDRMERDRMAMQYMKQPQEMVQLDILPWHAGPEQQGRGEEWVRTGRGKAVIHKESGVVEVCGEEGAKEVLRVVVGILGSLRVWGLGGEFKEVLEQLVNR